MQKPVLRPNNPCFSSGPCAKRPGWDVSKLDVSMMGRSHRAAPAKAQLQEIIDLHREILGIPADYRIGIVPASDTGAVEMAMWSMLGERPVDIFSWEVFGQTWLKDATDHLKLERVRDFSASYGELPDLSQAHPDHDVIFTWNGTTSGVRVPDGNWISPARAGITICDATSAVFAYDMPWPLLDVTTWSWQKVLGSEGAHGMIVLSPRAVERLETFKAPRPLPKIFRMTQKGKLMEGLFAAETINTPSMLAAADCLDALKWVKSIGGFAGTKARSAANFAAVDAWVKGSDWADFLARVPETRSKTSVCLKIKDPWFETLAADARHPFIKAMVKPLDQDGIAYDIAGHKDAAPGIRIWCGATVEAADVSALLPWLDWAYAQAKAG